VVKTIREGYALQVEEGVVKKAGEKLSAAEVKLAAKLGVPLVDSKPAPTDDGGDEQ
jgi:hypothetical protein